MTTPAAVPVRVVVDANAIDPLIDQADAYETLQAAITAGTIEVLYTHVTVDELAVVPDEERRKQLLLALLALGRLVPTGAFVVGYSRLNHARPVDDAEGFEAFRSGHLKHTADALIAATAAAEQADVVTADKRLVARSQARGLRAISMPTLLEMLALPDAGSDG